MHTCACVVYRISVPNVHTCTCVVYRISVPNVHTSACVVYRISVPNVHTCACVVYRYLCFSCGTHLNMSIVQVFLFQQAIIVVLSNGQSIFDSIFH